MTFSVAGQLVGGVKLIYSVVYFLVLSKWKTGSPLNMMPTVDDSLQLTVKSSIPVVGHFGKYAYSSI